jgi:hypothetical protein
MKRKRNYIRNPLRDFQKCHIIMTGVKLFFNPNTNLLAFFKPISLD